MTRVGTDLWSERDVSLSSFRQLSSVGPRAPLRVPHPFPVGRCISTSGMGAPSFVSSVARRADPPSAARALEHLRPSCLPALASFAFARLSCTRCPPRIDAAMFALLLESQRLVVQGWSAQISARSLVCEHITSVLHLVLHVFASLGMMIAQVGARRVAVWRNA